MKKGKLIGRLFGIALVFALVGSTVGGLPAFVNKAEASPATEIWDWYDLDAIRNNLDGDYILMNGPDSTTNGYTELAGPTANDGKGWQPIGAAGMPFAGSFDGQGYEIRDLFINRRDEGWVGLFGYVGMGGIIENLGVVNIEVTGGRRVGGLVGENIPGSTVSNSYSTGSVTGFSCVGGLVGRNNGTVSDSYASGRVTGTEAVGGLVGFNDWGTIRNSHYNYDEVLIHGENVITIGALFGADFEEWLANGKFLDVNERLSKEDSYYVINNINDFKQLLAFGQNASLKFRLNNDLNLATAPNLYIPYLAGEFDGNGHKISNLSFNFGVIQVGLFGYLASCGRVTQVGVENVDISADLLVGGLVGDNRGAVSKSYATGRVTNDHGAGGLVGYNEGTVSNSYANVNATSRDYVGGLVGYNNGGTVKNSYSSGRVTGNELVGGLVGDNEGPVSNSFWDIETSGQTTSEGGTGRTTSQMKSLTTFSGAGWNIIAVANPDTRNPSYIWNIVDGVTYPFLSWEERTWYVDDDLVDYPAADFTTIQDAVDAASPGDTIIVYPGTYIENVDVNKDHLTIQSQNGANSTIVQAANPNDHIFEVIADHVNISGFTVTGASGVGPFASYAGICLSSVEHCNISNNYILNNCNGIWLQESSNNTLSENNVSSSSYRGIILVESSYNLLANNSANSNNSNGILSYGGAYNTVFKNTMDFNNATGMAVEYSNHNTISQNSACSNAADGIHLWDATYNTISNNEALGNTVHNGISLGASHNNTIADNIASANCHNGINLYAGSTNNQLIHNTLLENNAHGIAIDSSPGNVIMQNTVSSNNCGIGIYKSSSNNLIYLNSFMNANNVCSDDQSTNMWDSPEEIAYSYNGETYTSFLGNYWSDYTGSDADGDGIGETPYPIDSDADNYPLVEPFENYAAGGVTTVNISLQPTTKNVGVGEVFDLVIQAEAGDQPVSGIAAFVNFNPAYLEVQSVTAGATLPTVIQNTYDNTAGTIDYGAGKLGEPSPTGTFTVATVQFRAKAMTSPSTALTFSTDLPRETRADHAGSEVTGTITGGTVSISSGARVDISVVLQGGSRSSGGWEVPITIKFFSPGANVMTGTPLEQFDLTTTKSGSTAICQCSVAPGTYDITAVSEHTLINVKRNVVISAPSTAVYMGTLLEGNANNDGIINISDFGILAESYMKMEGGPGYDARADFDRNGIVDITDFGLLADNYGKISPIDVSA